MGKLVTWYKDNSYLQMPPRCTADPYKLQKLGWLGPIQVQSAMIYQNLVVHLKEKIESILLCSGFRASDSSLLRYSRQTYQVLEK
jgi:hypothetical protein